MCSRKLRKIDREKPVSESLFNKVVDCRSASLLKRYSSHRCSPVSFAKIFPEHFFRR